VVEILVRLVLSIVVTAAWVYLFWRYYFGSFYQAPFGEYPWPIREKGSKTPCEDLSYTMYPPANIRNRFVFDEGSKTWNMTLSSVFLLGSSVLVSIILIWAA